LRFKPLSLLNINIMNELRFVVSALADIFRLERHLMSVFVKIRFLDFSVFFEANERNYQCPQQLFVIYTPVQELCLVICSRFTSL